MISNVRTSTNPQFKPCDKLHDQETFQATASLYVVRFVSESNNLHLANTSARGMSAADSPGGQSCEALRLVSISSIMLMWTEPHIDEHKTSASQESDTKESGGMVSNEGTGFGNAGPRSISPSHFRMVRRFWDMRLSVPDEVAV